VSHFWTYIRDALCKALSAAEREAVMGDFAELGLTDRRAATSLLELVLRRQLRAWKEWQPWFTTLAIILPVCPLLAMLCTQLSMSVWPSCQLGASRALLRYWSVALCVLGCYLFAGQRPGYVVVDQRLCLGRALSKNTLGQWGSVLR
jgi:hypothetical protein